MRNSYSRTAEAVALARALQQNLPQRQRILDDPYASAFLQQPYLRFVANSPLRSWLLSRFLDFWATGGQEFVAIRARLSDDLAKEMAAEGLKQLVLLGAGFDSMALRIKDALAGATVFEVDHPATQAAKRKAMARFRVPDNLRFVAVDFEKEDFRKKLEATGFDSTNRSLVIWMGVSYYLSEQAMERALTQIGSLSGPGLRLAFDYFLKEVIDKSTRNREALLAATSAAQIGEPWIFGLEPDDVSDYLAGFGFKLIKDYEPDELRSKYCPRGIKPLDYARIIVCERMRV